MSQVENKSFEWDKLDQLKQEKPVYYAAEGLWPRFNRYEIRRLPLKFEVETDYRKKCRECGRHLQVKPAKRNIWAICPAKNASLEWYKPFEAYPDILLDFLDLAESLVRDSKYYSDIGPFRWSWIIGTGFLDLDYGFPDLADEWIQNRLTRDGQRILGFYNKYGQLAGDLSKGLEFDQFYLLGILGLVSPRKARRWLKGNFNEEYKLMIDGLLRKQNEDVRKTYVACYHLHAWADLWRQYCAAGGNIDGYFDKSIPWREVFSRFTVRKMVVRVAPKRRNWQIDYDFDRLFHAIKLMFLNNISSEKNQIRMCALPECGHAFLAVNPRAKYCCNSHAIRARVRHYRNGIKKSIQTDATSTGETEKNSPANKGNSRKK